MNEEIEYAEMLEIPVSTVNVEKKRRKSKRIEKIEQEKPALKESVIAQVNDRLNDEAAAVEQITAEADAFAESANSEGELHFDAVSERIDTVRLYSTDEERKIWDRERLRAEDFALDGEYVNEGSRYETKSKKISKTMRIALGVEFAACCALCGAIFLTNVFMPSSAINTFFRALNNPSTQTATDKRVYSEFTLSPVVGDLSDAELTLSPTGILSFTDAGCVYPAVDGKVQEVTQDANGVYTLKIEHSETFTEVLVGLDHVYYAVGEEVKSNVPVGYSNGEHEVQLTMYSDGELLNCFQLSEENELSWVLSES